MLLTAFPSPPNFAVEGKAFQSLLFKQKSSTMKRVIIYLMVLSTAITIGSCKKDKDDKTTTPSNYKCTTCVSSPDAVAANDGSSKGVYKGVVIGSSGTIEFSVMNGSNDITATMVIDGTTVTLTSSIQWANGSAYVAPFTGQLNGQTVSITFSVQPDGSDPQILSSDIPGHPNASFTLVKETSNALIECFEGTYSTTRPESGTFNILLSRALGKFGGESRENGQTETDGVSGSINNGTLLDNTGHTIGSLSGDTISGNFKDSNGNTVTFSGKRTL